MTNPQTPDPSASRSKPQPTEGPRTMQGLEQSAQQAGQPPVRQAGAAGDELAVIDPDEPSPPTVPRYLRTRRVEARRANTQGNAPAGFDARTGILTAQTAALVDALTRGVAEALAIALRPIVASTVDTLIPMILTLGSVPDPVTPGSTPDAATAGVADLEAEGVAEAEGIGDAT